MYDDEESLERPPKVVEVDASDLDGVLELPRLHLDLHQETPLVVVRLGEHRPRRPRSQILVDGLQSTPSVIGYVAHDAALVTAIGGGRWLHLRSQSLGSCRCSLGYGRCLSGRLGRSSGCCLRGYDPRNDVRHRASGGGGDTSSGADGSSRETGVVGHGG
jgi:hypothetical protein